MLDGGLVAFQRATGRSLRRPPQRPQDAPGVHGGILHPAFALDQIGDAPRGPQARGVSERLRPALESGLDAPQISRAQRRGPPSPRGAFECRSPAGRELRRPPVHRLPVHADPAGHFGLAQALLQQPGALETPLLQLDAIECDAGGMSHAGQYTRIRRDCHSLL